MRICDLHTHSVFSDGTCTPAEIVCAAEAAGISAVALCDHNTVDGLPAFPEAVKGHGVQAVAGAEFSVEHDGSELHLLGLFIPPERFADVAELMREAVRAGLVGMECRYSTYDEATAAAATALAAQHGLLPSGGSDFHGDNKSDIALGRGRGDLAVPYDWYEALRERVV